MAAPLPRLQYFDIEAAAEKVRLAFAVCNQEFTDERIPFAEWGAKKASMPYGQLPVLHVPGDFSRPLTQSAAMVRYIAAKFDSSNLNLLFI